MDWNLPEILDVEFLTDEEVEELIKEYYDKDDAEIKLAPFRITRVFVTDIYV